MLKRFIPFTIMVAMITVILFVVHIYALDYLGEALRFSLTSMYIFHAIAYMVICLCVEFLYSKMPNQVGYAYLASVFIKIGLFVLVFKAEIFGDEPLSMAERLSVVVPLFLFIAFEAIYCGKLMNSAGS